MGSTPPAPAAVSPEEEPLPHVFFFVGHFNDVDHLAPVAYKFCQSERGRPVVVVTDPLYDIRGDYRLRFLKERYGVPVLSTLHFHPVSPLLGWLANLLRLPMGKGFLHRRRVYSLMVLRKLFYDKKWVNRIMDRYHPQALVFEWTDPTNGVTGAFVSAGKERGIPSFSLPHGVLIWTNSLVNRQEQLRGRTDRDYHNLFDRAVYENNLHANRAVEEGVLPDRVVVLGSARYCEEWQQTNLGIQPVLFSPRKGQESAYKVVFMLPQWHYNADFEATMQALRRLGEEPWLHLVVKAHTRETSAHPSFLREVEVLPNVEVAGEVGSVALIRWADAVISISSDIALEVLRQGKVNLDPRYLHENTTVLQEIGAEWGVFDDQELVTALTKLSQGQPPPYGEEQISKVIAKLVSQDPAKPDVLAGYVDFIQGGWREYPTYEDQLQTNGKPVSS